MSRSRVLLVLSVLCTSALLVPEPARAESPPIVVAAQRGDVARVAALLEAGADVNARSDYGATPLFFACDKGSLEMAELLLAHGADPEIEDTFYGATPLGWIQFGLAESAEHRSILLAMLEHLSPEGEPLDDLLMSAVESQDGDLLRSLIAAGRVSGPGLGAARGVAEEASPELTTILDEAIAASDNDDVFDLPAERRAQLLGRYEASETGSVAEIVWSQGSVQIDFGGGGRILLPRSRSEFGVLGRADTTVFFQPTDRTAAQMRWVTPENTFEFRRVPEEPETTTSEAEGSENASDPRATAGGTEVAGAGTSTAGSTEGPQRLPAAPWPEFRGNGRSGIADGQGLPVEWTGTTGEGVRWKTEIPGLGLSSPVIWGNRVFVTTAESQGGDDSLRTGLYGDVDSVEDDSVQVWKTYALDLDDGKVLWEREAHRGRPAVRRHLKSSHASPSAAVDERHLIVSFGSAGLYAYDHGGELRWRKDLGTLSAGWFYDPTYEWEFASSPILWKGNVLVQVDINGGSFVASFEASTGEELWRTERDEISSWGTPTVLASPDGPAELVTNARTIRGYDVESGKELWTLTPNSEITVASPVVAGGLVYVTGGYPPARPIYALRPGSRGSLDLPDDETSSSAVAWSTPRRGTYLPTPIVYRGQLYVLHNNGRLAVYDASTGDEVYRARVGHSESFSASPIAADGNLYFSSEDGTTFVVRAGAEYDLVTENELGETLMATPAASDGTLVLRGQRHLFGIGAPPADTRAPEPSNDTSDR